LASSLKVVTKEKFYLAQPEKISTDSFTAVVPQIIY